ncbi:MAG: hypothetical protein PHN57_08910, partial [Candidatus Omnitrophica bacterium]|nr:hypothetical protein [Candidatus Omnitrophota bacterium]
PFSRQPLQTNFNSDPQYKNIKISAASFGGGNVLRFDWNGTPQDASGTNLTQESSVSFSFKGGSNVIYVTANTGNLRVQ